MTESSTSPHIHPLAVEPGDIDFMGHVNNSVYLQWVQEAVIAYWRRVAPAEAVAQHLWVAVRHEITYRRPAFLEDNVADSALPGLVAFGIRPTPMAAVAEEWLTLYRRHGRFAKAPTA